MLFFAPDPAFRGAPCVDASEEQKKLFFSLGNGYKNAQKICGTCPKVAMDACLQLALENEVPGEERFGVYGGLSARERKRLYG